MLSLIALLPGFIAFYIALTKSPEKAFLNVFLPCLMLIPPDYGASIIGLPDFSFSGSALAGVFIVAIFQRLPEWKLQWMDLLVFTFIGVITYSEYINRQGSYEGITRTVFSQKVQLVLLPYMLAKLLIHKRNFTTLCAKRIVILMVVNLVICVYEWRMMSNLHVSIFAPFFPDAPPLKPPHFRFGNIRLSGPFALAILYGIGISVCLLISLWLTRNHLWEKRFNWLPRNLTISKPFVINMILLIGLLMTFSRGPLLSTFLGCYIIGAAYSKHPNISFFVRSVLLVAMVIVLWKGTLDYTSAGRGGRASSILADSAAYRIELLQVYETPVKQRPLFGWGSYQWPEGAGMKSIDNHYLWITLKHGLIATALLIFMLLWSLLQLTFRAVITPPGKTIDRAFAFTLMGLIISYAIVIATVYMGAQTEPIFFIILGWSQGFLLTAPRRNEEYQIKHALTKVKVSSELPITP